MDVSPKGDPPGFVRVLDSKSLPFQIAPETTEVTPFGT